MLNHLSSRAFNGMVSAGTLAVSQHRLDHRWRNRFGAAVVEHARTLGLCRRRYDLVQTVPPIVAGSVALVAWVAAVTRGTDVAFDASWRPRAIALATLVALALLVRDLVLRITGSDQVATEAGRARAAAWLGYRRRLRARIPESATVLAPPAQQGALAVACVMGVAEQVHEQLPVAQEDGRWAWSEAGPEARVVRVRYPAPPRLRAASPAGRRRRPRGAAGGALGAGLPAPDRRRRSDRLAARQGARPDRADRGLRLVPRRSLLDPDRMGGLVGRGRGRRPRRHP